MTPETDEQTTITRTDAKLTISRTFDAPRERLWQAWTGPDGDESRGKVVYEEIVEPELVLTHEGLPTDEMIEGAEIGWTGSLDELEAHLEGAMTDEATDGGASSDASEPSVTVHRTIDASSERVFDAWLNPDEIEGWMFPAETDEVVAVDIDPRVDGAFSFVVRRDGDEIDHVGRYLEIDRPRSLAFTWGTADDDGEDRVTVEITTVPAGCEVTLTHELDPEWADYADRTAEAWTTMLDALAGHLEDGDR